MCVCVAGCVCVCLCAQNRGYQGLGASGAANSINSPTYVTIKALWACMAYLCWESSLAM